MPAYRPNLLRPLEPQPSNVAKTVREPYLTAVAARPILPFALPAPLATVAEEARLAARALADFAGHVVHPTLRLGVTGLSGAGKTVFITALVHALLHGGRLAGVGGAA